jgi:hypothetical protein
MLFSHNQGYFSFTPSRQWATEDNMSTDKSDRNRSERRAEVRTPAERFYSVQFKTTGLASYYQFKLRNTSTKGLCILVKEGSDVLNHINVGDTIEMTYYLTDATGGHENLKTEIKHITKNENGRFQGHFMIGLSIL